MGRPASKVTRVLVTGPLAPFAPMLKARLRERGYTPLSTVIVMRLVAHLSRWLDANALGVSDLAGEQVERYIAARRGPHLGAVATQRGFDPGDAGRRGSAGPGDRGRAGHRARGAAVRLPAASAGRAGANAFDCGRLCRVCSPVPGGLRRRGAGRADGCGCHARGDR